MNINIFWFRRDLRLKNNRGLSEALSHDLPVLPIFIFDTHILSKLSKKDHRVGFIHEALEEMSSELAKHGAGLRVFHGDPLEVYKKILKDFEVNNVFTNHDYEPYAIERDDHVRKFLQKNNIEFLSFKDQVIFERDEVVKGDGSFYSVYTPYSNKWKELFQKTKPNLSYKSESKLDGLVKKKAQIPSLRELGFEKSEMAFPKKTVRKEIFLKYKEQRDFPALMATSHLGVHLRFGTVSIRDLVSKALELKATAWLNELIWREFFMQILYHNPSVVNKPFKKKYANIKWENSQKNFRAWCEGKTGYPLVDAGMRELNQKGFMHNRARMITASFLVKHLLINWRWGEKYFAEKLFDFDLSANNGNWQWVAGCGCDAAPYFRIFNPIAQQEKFDKGFEYIKKWVPEYGTSKYVDPIVDHDFARKRCLKAFEVVGD